MSEERRVSKHESGESELRQLLYTLVDALTGESNISRRIEMLLDGAIAYYGADRAYVIEGDAELITGVNTYERCAPGIEPQQDTLKDMPPEGYVHWLEVFRRFEEIAIPDMEAIKESSPGEYRYFHNSNVDSIIVVPFSKRINQGFVGVDNPKHHKTDTMPLRVLSYAVVLELNEIKLTKEKAALLQISEVPEHSVQVHLLGQLKISAHGGTIYQKNLSPQGQALLTIMLLNPERTFSIDDMYDVISSDKESSNPAGVVSNVLYRLRIALDIIGLKNLIILDRGSYSLNPVFHVETDASKFLQFYNAMQAATDPEKKLRLCHDALTLYKNPLQPNLCDSVRWIMECSDMHTKFLNTARECIRLHLERGEYRQAYEITMDAMKSDPHEPEMMLLMAKVMKLANRPGLKNYVRKIMPFMDAEEQKQLQEILQSGDTK